MTEVHIQAAFAPAAAAVAAGKIPGATLGVVAADGRRWTATVAVNGQQTVDPYF